MSDPYQFSNTSDPRFARWWKSSRSNGSDGCLYVSADMPAVVALADSKAGPGAPIRVVDRSAWTEFVAAVKAGYIAR